MYVYGVLGVLVEAMTIDPLAHTKGRHQQSSDDDTAGHFAEAVYLSTADKLYTNAASDGVGGDTINGAAVLRVDGELHWLVG